MNRFVSAAMLLCLCGCASIYTDVKPHTAYQKNIHLPLDGVWRSGSRDFRIFNAVMAYPDNYPESDLIGKARAIDIEKEQPGIYAAKCLTDDGSDAYYTPCRIKLAQPDNLVVTYSRTVELFELVSTERLAELRKEINAFGIKNEVLRDYTRCSEDCTNISDSCVAQCSATSYSNMNMNVNASTVARTNYEVCAGKCRRTGESCLSECTSIIP